VQERAEFFSGTPPVELLMPCFVRFRTSVVKVVEAFHETYSFAALATTVLGKEHGDRKNAVRRTRPGRREDDALICPGQNHAADR
jgi:hypothetical protein